MGIDLDDFIERHLHASKVINGKNLKYTVEELKELCELSIEILGKEPSLVKIKPPCIIVGDILGQYYDLLRMFSFYSARRSKKRTMKSKNGSKRTKSTTK